MADRPKARHEKADDDGLPDQQAGDDAENRQPLGDDHPDIDHHAHRHEEQAEKQPAERPDIGLDLMPVLGLGEQQSGEEGAQRHGKAGHGEDQARPQYDQQGGGNEQLGTAGRGDQTVDRPQYRPADDDGDDQRDNGLQARLADRRQQGGPLLVQQRHQDQQRHDDQILEQQDGEGHGAVGCGPLAALGQQLEDERGRRQGEARPDDDCRVDGNPERQRDPEDDGAGERDLRRAQAEYVIPELLEPPERQFKADGEQQKHHAELGQRPGALGIADEAEAVGADENAGRQVADHRARFQALEEGDDDDGGDQQDQDVRQDRRQDRRVMHLRRRPSSRLYPRALRWPRRPPA